MVLEYLSLVVAFRRGDRRRASTFVSFGDDSFCTMIPQPFVLSQYFSVLVYSWSEFEPVDSCHRTSERQLGFRETPLSSWTSDAVSAVATKKSLQLFPRSSFLPNPMIAALSSSVLAFGPPSSRFAGRHAFKVSRSNLAAAAMANPMATFKTSMGDFTAELYADKLPITAGNFADLAKTGFYDGLSFHRVISGFMCQFGCPNSKDPMSPVAGTGGPAPGTSFTLADGTSIERNGRGCIPDELVAEISNDPGTLSMANTGQPDTGGSQIFVNLVRNDFLDYFNPSTPSKHPVFGKVVEGMDVVEAIGATPTNKAMGDRPVTPVVVETIVIS